MVVYMFKRLAALICCAALPLAISVAAVNAEVFQGYDSADFVAQPTVVTKLDSEDSIESLRAEQAPNVVWMVVDSSLQIVSGADESLGSFADIYADEVSGTALPVVQPQDAAALAALADYVSSSPIDELAIAGDLSILTQAQEEISSARLYYIASDAATDALRQTQLGLANTAGAQVVVLESEEASAESVAYYQARFKSVWVITDGSAVQIADAVGSGAYGVISPDAAPVYDLYDKIGASAEDGARASVLSRAPFVAAHRGYTGLHAENTVGAIEDAAAVGATHVEIDIRFSEDKEIVVYHNDNITYNGSSVPVSSLTLSELQSVSLAGGTSEDVIPTIEDVFEAVESGETGDLILIIEFKGREAELVTSFAEKVAEYNMQSRVVVISFFPEQLQRVRAQLPTISTSYLLNATDGSAERALASAKSVNSGIDLTKDALTSNYGDGTLESAYNEIFRTFADRGYALWMWTYETNDTARAAASGVTGITTNEAAMGAQIHSLSLSDTLEVQALPADGDTIAVPARTYAGDEVTVSARVILLSQGENEAQAVLVAQPETGVGLVSGSVTLRVAENGGQTGGSGCNSTAGIAGTGAALFLLLGGAGLAVKKKR